MFHGSFNLHTCAKKEYVYQTEKLDSIFGFKELIYSYQASFICITYNLSLVCSIMQLQISSTNNYNLEQNQKKKLSKIKTSTRIYVSTLMWKSTNLGLYNPRSAYKKSSPHFLFSIFICSLVFVLETDWIDITNRTNHPEIIQIDAECSDFHGPKFHH